MLIQYQRFVANLICFFELFLCISSPLCSASAASTSDSTMKRIRFVDRIKHSLHTILCRNSWVVFGAFRIKCILFALISAINLLYFFCFEHAWIQDLKAASAEMKSRSPKLLHLYDQPIFLDYFELFVLSFITCFQKNFFLVTKTNKLSFILVDHFISGTLFVCIFFPRLSTSSAGTSRGAGNFVWDAMTTMGWKKF